RDRNAGFLDDIFERTTGPVQQIRGHILEFGAGQVFIEVHRAVFSDREVLQRNIRRGGRRQFLLGLFGGFLQTLQSNLVLGQVSTGGLGLFQQPVNDGLVPVVTTQTVVTGGGANLHGGEIVVILANFQQGDVEGTATEVKDQDQFIFFTAFQTVGQCGRGWFVNNA